MPFFVNTTRRRTWFLRVTWSAFAVLAVLALDRIWPSIARPVPHTATPLELTEAPWHPLIAKRELPWTVSPATAWSDTEREKLKNDRCYGLELLARHYPYWALDKTCDEVAAGDEGPYFDDKTLVLGKGKKSRLVLDIRGVVVEPKR